MTPRNQHGAVGPEAGPAGFTICHILVKEYGSDGFGDGTLVMDADPQRLVSSLRWDDTHGDLLAFRRGLDGVAYEIAEHGVEQQLFTIKDERLIRFIFDPEIDVPGHRLCMQIAHNLIKKREKVNLRDVKRVLALFHQIHSSREVEQIEDLATRFFNHAKFSASVFGNACLRFRESSKAHDARQRRLDIVTRNLFDIFFQTFGAFLVGDIHSERHLFIGTVASDDAHGVGEDGQNRAVFALHIPLAANLCALVDKAIMQLGQLRLMGFRNDEALLY